MTFASVEVKVKEQAYLNRDKIETGLNLKKITKIKFQKVIK